MTDEAIRWHAFSDHVPGMPPRNDWERLLAPTRDVRLQVGVGVSASETRPGSNGMPVRAMTISVGYEAGRTEADRYYSFVIPEDPSTDELIRYVIERTSE